MPGTCEIKCLFFHTVVKTSDRWVVDLIEVDNSVVNKPLLQKIPDSVVNITPYEKMVIKKFRLYCIFLVNTKIIFITAKKGCHVIVTNIIQYKLKIYRRN